jgi:O-antigen/teichoic acid export membrane protein
LRTKSAIKIILSSILLQFVIAVSGLILPKLLIETYGSTLNGLLSSSKQILNYFGILTVGLGASSQVALYKPLEERDYTKINGVLSATRVFFNQTGYLILVLMVLLTFIFPYFLSKEVNYYTAALIIFITGVGSLIQYSVVSKYTILLVADQKNYVASWIATQGTIIYTIMTVVLVYFEFSIILVQLIATIVFILRLFMTITYVKKQYPQISYKGNPDFKSISNRWDAFLYQLPSVIIANTPIIIVALLLSLKDASVFSVYSMVFVSLGMIVNVFVAGFSASFGNVIVQGSLEKLRNSFNTYEFIYTNILFFCYTCALILIIPFVRVYLDNNDGVNYVLPSVALLFTFSGLLRSLRTPSVTLVEAAGKFKENKWQNIGEAILNVALSLVLVFPFGINGVLISSALTGFTRSIGYFIYSSKYILLDNYLKRILINISNILLMVALYKYIPEIKPENLLLWVFDAIKLAFICLPIIVILNTILNFRAATDAIKRLKMVRGSLGN